MKGAVIAMDLILIVGVTIALVIGLVFLLLSEFNPLEEFITDTTQGARSAVSSITGGNVCAGLPQSCRRWVNDGLGFYFAYNEAKIYESAGKCAVKDTVCPSSGNNREGVKECFEMCVEILKCENYEQYYEGEYEDFSACFSDVLDEYGVDVSS